MEKKRHLATIVLLTAVWFLLAACGREEYVAELGVGGCVFSSRKIQSIKYFGKMAVSGEWLYYRQDGDDRHSIMRTSLEPLLSGEGELDFSGSQLLATIFGGAFEMPEEALDDIEDLDFAWLLKEKRPSERELRAGTPYLSFSLDWNFSVDQEQNLYFHVSIFGGKYLDGEPLGGVLCKQSEDGESAYCVYLPEMQDFAVDGQGRAYILAEEEGIIVLDSAGIREGTISTDGYRSGDGNSKQELFADMEGRVFYCSRRDSWNKWDAYEIFWGEKTPFRDAGDFLGDYAFHYAAFGGNVLLYTRDSGNMLYEYDRDSGSTRELLYWPDSGLMNNKVRFIVQISPDILLVSYGDYADARVSDEKDAEIYQLTRIPVDELQEKEVMVIASARGGSLELQQAVMQFNAHSATHRVVIADYNAYYSETEGRVVWPQLDAALVSSHPPDMLDLQNMDFYKYACQGVLEDLSPYLEASSRLGREDFLENMLEDITVGEKLVCIPVSFCIDVVAGRVSQAGSLESWTMEDVYRLEEMYPEAAQAAVSDGCGGGKGRDYLLEEFCSAYYLECFVDWESRNCSFDSDEFRRLLKWAGEHGGEPNYTSVAGGNYVLKTDYVSEKELLVFEYGLDFLTLLTLEIQCGEEMRLMGVPSADGQGNFRARIFEPIAITANSPNKDAAWEFLEFFFLMKQTDSQSSFALPTYKKALQNLYQDAVTPLYLLNEDGSIAAVYDENGNKDKTCILERTRRIHVGEDEYFYYFTPGEQADAVMDVVARADFRPLTEAENTIIKIIAEESASYYSGQRGLEEVTGIIQNRVQLLLDEK